MQDNHPTAPVAHPTEATVTDRSDLTTRPEINALKPGDRVEIYHEIKVGLKVWGQTTTGTVERIERRRQGLHFRRNMDDKAFCDLIVLRLPDNSLTTVTMDEFSRLRKL